MTDKEKYSAIVHICADNLSSGHTIVILRAIVKGESLDSIKEICSRPHSKNSKVAHLVNAILNDEDVLEVLEKLPPRIRTQGDY